MRSPYQLSALFLALAVALIAPLALHAGELPQAGASCPAPAASATSLAAIFQTPSPLPAAGLGVCASSCNPATCHRGPHGFCQQLTCTLGQRPSTCGTGDSCIPIPDCN